jgi:uncharacterized membrane protein
MTRLGGIAAVVVLAVAALPTTIVDLYNAQDLTNQKNGPTFPWVLRLTRGEVEALDWLKTHTPPNVVVQPDVQGRGTSSWGYMPAFGERRMAAGLPIAMIPMQPYQEATDMVGEQVFAHGKAKERAAAARRMGIDYLWVGPDDRDEHPDLMAVLESRADLFPVVYRNRDVVIYWVAP